MKVELYPLTLRRLPPPPPYIAYKIIRLKVHFSKIHSGRTSLWRLCFILVIYHTLDADKSVMLPNSFDYGGNIKSGSPSYSGRFANELIATVMIVWT